MKRSTDRILTTHAGSLPRTHKLVELMAKVYRGEDVNEGELDAEIETSTAHVLRRQLEVGIDVANDGEHSRESFFTYVQHRLSGFGGRSEGRLFHDVMAFPDYVEMLIERGENPVNLRRPPKGIGAVEHVDRALIVQECDRFDRLSQGMAFTERFVTAASPGIVCAAMPSEHYASYEEYVMAVAAALRTEYEVILERGFLLQLDCPDLAMERHVSFGDRPLEEFKAFVETNVGALQTALDGLPADRIRLHVCWGNYNGPHHLDVDLEEILPQLYEAPVGALLLPFANPRHEHEWRALKGNPPPGDRLIVAGVIDTTTTYVEHPETVADRIERVADAIGDPTRVLAGTDCGFDTAAGLGQVPEDIVWAKLQALRAGADLATKRLF